MDILLYLLWSNSQGKEGLHSPAQLSTWQSFNYSPGKPCPVVLGKRGQLAALPSFFPMLVGPAILGGPWENTLSL